MVLFFCRWFRRFFELDESRFRMSVYLHQGLDLEAAETFWSELTGVPRTQFLNAYRAIPDPSIRANKHEFGCAYVKYASAPTHRAVMGMVRALLSPGAIPG
jgi:hypothetical protein